MEWLLGTAGAVHSHLLGSQVLALAGSPPAQAMPGGAKTSHLLSLVVNSQGNPDCLTLTNATTKEKPLCT